MKNIFCLTKSSIFQICCLKHGNTLIKFYYFKQTLKLLIIEKSLIGKHNQIEQKSIYLNEEILPNNQQIVNIG